MPRRSKTSTAVLSSIAAMLIGGLALLGLMALDRARVLASRGIVYPPFGYNWQVSPDPESFLRVVAELDARRPDGAERKLELTACPAILDLDWRDPFIRQARLVIGVFSYQGLWVEDTITLYDSPVPDAIVIHVPVDRDIGGNPKARAVVADALHHESWITKNVFDLACDGSLLCIRLHGPAAVSST
jgi:hypothetical protein